MRSARIGILGILGLAAGMMACPFTTSGTGTPFGGTGGSGGAGGATGTTASVSTGPPPTVCKPGTTQPCYEGLAGTTDAGAPCAAGTETCEPSGLGWGACLGAVMPVPDNCADGLNLHCDNPKRTCTGTPGSGSVTFGEPGDDAALGVAVDAMSNAVVGGLFHGTLDFGSGPMVSVPTGDNGADGFVAKIDPTGSVLWALDVGGPGDDQVTSVAVDASGDVFVTGTYAHAVAFDPAMGPGMFVAKLDASTGIVVWGHAYPAPTIVPGGIAVGGTTPHVAVAGYFSGMFPVPGAPPPLMAKGATDGFVLDLTAAGAFVWIKQVSDTGPGPQAEALYGVAINPAGSVLVTGEGAGAVEFGDGMATALPGNGEGLALAKYGQATGTISWKALYGATQFATGAAVTTDTGGNVYVTGNFTGTLTLGNPPLNGSTGAPSLFVAQFAPDGNTGWSTALAAPSGGSGSSNGFGVACDTYSVVVAGDFTGQIAAGSATLASASGNDVLVAKLDLGTGGLLWAQQLGSSSDNEARGVAMDPTVQDPLGKSVAVGWFSAPISFGTTADGGTAPIASQGGKDVFVVRLAP